MSYKKNIVASGLTGKTSLTQHSLLCGAAASPVSLVPVGSSGELLQSNASSADPSWTTATYPTTAGNAGNVLTSDGTNWISSLPSGGGLQLATGTLTSSQVKNLHGTPITAIAAPGANKAIMLVSTVSKLNYGGTNAFSTTTTQNISAYYTTSLFTGYLVMDFGTLQQTSNRIAFRYYQGCNDVATSFSNKAIYLYNPDSSEITGNAANNNTVTWWILYYTISV